MKIFITGCCGFIGFNFANFLAKTNKKIRVVGIDNFSDYYSVSYKKKRLKELVQKRNFKFYKIDINQNKKLIKLYKKYHFNYVFHFAAQAGVRYSLINPKTYIENNISGFFNVLNLFSSGKAVVHLVIGIIRLLKMNLTNYLLTMNNI